MCGEWKLTQSEKQGALVPRSRAGVHVHNNDAYGSYGHASDLYECVLAQWNEDCQDGILEALKLVPGMEEG